MDRPAGAEDSPSHVEIKARLCTWRVFGLSRDFSDRPDGSPSWTSSAQLGAGVGDQITITIGEIPPVVIDSERAVMTAHRFAAIRRLTTELDCQTEADISNSLNDFYAETIGIEDEIRGPFSLWLTLELSRPLTVLADPLDIYFWPRNDSVIGQLEEFATTAEPILDEAVARLLPTLGDKLLPERLLFDRRRSYLVSDGRRAFALPNPKVSFNPTIVSSGWAELPFESISGSIANLGLGGEKNDKAIRSAAQWLQAAMRETDDPLRRFLFAFIGLEALTGRIGKTVERSVIHDLSTELGLPVENLVWPAVADLESPHRNLVFRFVLLATKVTRSSASTDIDEFKELAKYRNKLVHGSGAPVDADDLPAWRAIALLQKYLSLVAAADGDGLLG